MKLLVNGPAKAPVKIVLAHGAGASMDSPFMEFFAQGLIEAGFQVVRFEFPYMAERRVNGTKRPPDREDVLRRTWLDVLKRVRADRLVIGGKSLGGRIASLIADEVRPAALVCLGYPFHPPGKPDRPRTVHLAGLQTPALILQGERDALGNREEVASYTLSAFSQLHWLEDGDHSFRPRRSSGRSEAENWQESLGAIIAFLAAATASS